MWDEICQNSTWDEICFGRKLSLTQMQTLIGSLIKLSRISEVLMHGRFLENFVKSWKIILVTYKNLKVQAVPLRDMT